MHPGAAQGGREHWWYAVGHCFTAGRRSRHLDDLLRSDTFDLERFGVNGVRLIGFHEPLHVSADALAHGGVFAACEQHGEAADVVAVLLTLFSSTAWPPALLPEDGPLLQRVQPP